MNREESFLQGSPELDCRAMAVGATTVTAFSGRLHVRTTLRQAINTVLSSALAGFLKVADPRRDVDAGTLANAIAALQQAETQCAKSGGAATDRCSTCALDTIEAVLAAIPPTAARFRR